MRSTIFSSLGRFSLSAVVLLAVVQVTPAAWSAEPSDATAQTQGAGSGASASVSADPPATIPREPPAAATGESATPAPASASRSAAGTLKLILRERASEESSPAESAEPVGTPAAVPAKPPGDARLEPIPQAAPLGPVEVETASFKGVTPGTTTMAQVQESWGNCTQVVEREGILVQLYRVEPFDQVEVSFFEDVVSSIVIRLNGHFPAKTVTEQLELSDIRPVFVSNALGEILGQSFPERGVMFAFVPGGEPGKPTMQVAQIILEAVSAEPFLLRAETYLDTRLEFSAADLDQAIRLDPKNPRSHWLRSRALAAMGEETGAMKAAAEAVRLAPSDPQYRVTRAQILGQAGDFAGAIEEAEKALATGGQRPHIQAQAQCLLGDLLGSKPKPDYKQAIEHHAEAIETAELLVNNQHPAIRLAAEDVLVNAHLGAAHDIAWGSWNEKEKAVEKWIARAEAIVDELIEDEDRAAESRFRIACRAIAACVGAKGTLDPTNRADEVIRLAEALTGSAGQPAKVRRINGELGLALYDAVQVYQMRGEHSVALKYGERAIEALEQIEVAQSDNAADQYLLGRLYFRLGAIHALGSKNHRAAITWFEKAIPLFERSVARVDPAEVGRVGETLVSMGVSFWETDQRQKATELTRQGVEAIERAVDAGTLAEAALEIPYANLATMHRSLGDDDRAEEFLQKAARNRRTLLK